MFKYVKKKMRASLLNLVILRPLFAKENLILSHFLSGGTTSSYSDCLPSLVVRAWHFGIYVQTMLKYYSTSPIVHVIQIGRFEILEFHSEVLEQRPPLGIGLDLTLGPRNPETDKAADGHDWNKKRTMAKRNLKRKSPLFLTDLRSGVWRTRWRWCARLWRPRRRGPRGSGPCWWARGPRRTGRPGTHRSTPCCHFGPGTGKDKRWKEKLQDNCDI